MLEKIKKHWMVATLTGIVIIGAIILVAVFTGEKEVEAAPLQTAKARTGEIRVTVSGSGFSTPSNRVELAFASGGTVSKIYVLAGQEIIEGELLAELDNRPQVVQLTLKELALQALISPDALNAAEIARLTAQDDREDKLASLQYLISRTVYNSEVDLANAASALVTTKGDGSSQDVIKEAQLLVDEAEKKLASAMTYYKYEYIPTVLGYEPTAEEISFARAQVRTAELAVEDANLYIERLSSEDACADMTTVGAFTSKLNQACLDIELAQLTLDGTNLEAPFTGRVMSVEILAGQSVNTSPVLAVAGDNMLVHFYLEEADLPGVSAGLKTNITFDAYPDQVFTGELVQVDPELSLVDGSPAVSAWSTLDLATDDPTLLGGMTAEVEVVIGEAQKAILVPVQALRELAPGSYAVFVQAADGTLKMTPVTIGLRDIATVQILTGIQAGDVVSTGLVETK
jgi:RND family efflux transporter MFP subunit